ncbi:hypothetical protein BMS3Abin04_01221 [bacterium BMS3Abin04]|nr:hypothetical protein BMS3Abin04_01221 [bacterium BMS3Abin04]
MVKLNKHIILVLIILIFSLLSCINPFAPKIDNSLGSESSLISDQKSIQGVFDNFQYAYTFKDTTIYGKLLSSDFTFVYRDYTNEIDVAWGRDEEMKVTNGLFNNSERIDLIWNNIISITNDSSNIVRSFNLTVTFNPTDIIFVDGRVNLNLKKNAENKWQIVNWIDESNF